MIRGTVFPIGTASGAIASFPDGGSDVPLKSLAVNIDPVQSGSGDPSPDNVRPISGWTGAKVNRTGKNLLRLVQSEMVSSGWNRRFPFSIKAGTYKISCQNQFGATAQKPGCQIVLYDENETYLQNIAGGGSYSFGNTVMSATFTINENTAKNTKYLRINPRAAGLTFAQIESGEIMMELGSSSTAYEPYTGSVIPISFGDAGTVYGGTLDVTTGVLTVERAAVSISELSWTYSSTYGRMQTNGVKSLIEKPAGNDKRLNGLMCSAYTARAAVYTGSQAINDTIAVATTGDMYIRDEAYSDADAWKTAMGSQTIIYPLAEPQTYQLTPQEVSTLLGENNIWVDIGNVSLEYCKQISAIRGTSVYTTAAASTSREIVSNGVTTTQYGYILTIWDEKKYVSNPSSYTGDKFEIWNGIDGTGTVNSVDGFNVTGGTTNVQLDAVSFGHTQVLDAEAQQTARTNIDAFQDISNPSNGQIPRYSTESNKWLLRNLTPEEVGAVHSALTINGKAITNPTTSNASIVLNVNDIAGVVSASRTINSHALNTNITLTPNDIGALNSALTINGKTITNSTTSSASIKLDVNDVGAVPITRTINGRALTANIRTQTIASNKSVSTWSAVNTSSSIYNANFPYYANISIPGVTTDMVSEVIFDINDSMSGIFAPVAKTISGGVQIYASEIPENTITIPTIICFN